MKIDFKDYFLSEFKHTRAGHFRLYHDWLYDNMFADMDVPKDLVPLIKMAIFRASYSTMWTSEMLKLDYQKECLRRTKAPAGPLKGQTISKLSEQDRTLLPHLIALSRSKNELVSKAAREKISQIKFYTDENRKTDQS